MAHDSPPPLGPTPTDVTHPDAVDAAWRAHRQHSTEHAFVLMDLDGRVRAWSGAAESILGHREAEILGRSIDEVFTPEDRALGLSVLERSVALSGARSEDDRWHLRRDGSLVWLSGSMEVVRDPAGQPIALVKVMRDRTDLRMQIETLGHRVDALTAAAADRSAFFASLVHELRNALAPLSNASGLLTRSGPGDHAAFAAAMLHRQLELLQRMVSDLVDVAREDRCSLPLRIERFDLAALVRQVAETCAVRTSAADLDCRVLLPAEDVPIEADRARLHQCVYNLLDNALKYTPAGGRVWVRVTVEAQEALVRVEDTGEGIPHAFLPRIFELFTRGPAAGQKPGLGVGLHLVRQIVTAHGGSVEARSEGEGKGSIFTLRLPRTPGPATSVGDAPH